MARHEFEYWPEVAFPEHAVIEVAEALRVPKLSVDAPTGEEWNRAYIEGLNSTQLDLYYTALLGESAADIANSDEHGEVPPGQLAEDFARGGCYGDSLAVIPGIWAAKRELADELELMRNEIATSTPVQEARASFRDCMVDRSDVALEDPAAAEEAIASIADAPNSGAPTADELIAALQDCHPIWSEGYHAGTAEASQHLVERNRETLDAQLESYPAGIDAEIARDADFVLFLSQAAESAVADCLDAECDVVQ